MQSTVVIIDDNEDEVLLTKLAVTRTRREIKTKVALSGEAGIELLRRGEMPPRLVLLDLKMPRMDGFEVLRKIRSEESLRNIPVVIVTNSTLESDKQAAVKAGADSFLHKSTDHDQFNKDIESILACWLDTNENHS
jgi:two-component system, response regulator